MTELFSRRVLLSIGAALVTGIAATPRQSRAKVLDDSAYKPGLPGYWICAGDQCTPYFYDEALGDPDLDIPPGTRFMDLPDDFFCPDCGSGKEDFYFEPV